MAIATVFMELQYVYLMILTDEQAIRVMLENLVEFFTLKAFKILVSRVRVLFENEFACVEITVYCVGKQIVCLHARS